MYDEDGIYSARSAADHRGGSRRKRTLLGLAGSLGVMLAVGVSSVSTAYALGPTVANWTTAPIVNYSCSFSGTAEACSFNAVTTGQSCTETTVGGTFIGGCTVALNNGFITMVACTGTGSAVFSYTSSLGPGLPPFQVFATASGGVVHIDGAADQLPTVGEVHATFVLPCNTGSGTLSGSTTWSGQTSAL